jgi:hypothetical protein
MKADAIVSELETGRRMIYRHSAALTAQQVAIRVKPAEATCSGVTLPPSPILTTTRSNNHAWRTLVIAHANSAVGRGSGSSVDLL